MADSKTCPVPSSLAHSVLDHIQDHHGLRSVGTDAYDFKEVTLRERPSNRAIACLNFKESTLVITLWRDSGNSTYGIKYLVDLEYADPKFVVKLDTVINRAKEGFNG